MRRILIATLAVASFMVSPALADIPDFTVTIPDAFISENGDTTIDVLISSPNLKPLAIFGLYFTITSDMSNRPLSSLQFKDSQGTGYLNASNYVFAGNSLNQANLPSNPTGAPADFGGGFNNLLTPGDATNDFDPMTGTFRDYGSPINGNDPMNPTMLVRLYLTSTPQDGKGIAPIDGEKFTVSLLLPEQLDNVPPSTPSTYFQSYDQQNNGTVSTFTSTSGTVTVRSVPEPGSLALLLIGVPVGGYLLRRRKARAA